MSIRKVFSDLFTEADNNTFDLGRVLGALSIVYFLGLSTVELLQECKNFNLTEVSGGVAVLLMSNGFTTGYKYGKEKDKKE